MAAQSSPTKNWVFTVNLSCFDKGVPKEDCFPFSVTNPKAENFGVQALAWQPEVGLEGNKHIQGYLRLDKGKRDTAIRKAWPGVHFEPCKSVIAAIGYASKDDTFQGWDHTFESGVSVSFPAVRCQENLDVVVRQGERTDIKKLKEIVVKPGGLRTIAEDYPEQYLRFHSVLSKMAGLLSALRVDALREVIFLWGDAGEFKFRYGRYRSREPSFYFPCGRQIIFF